jgi:hypothetical protein
MTKIDTRIPAIAKHLHELQGLVLDALSEQTLPAASSSHSVALPIIGTPMAGGFFGGVSRDGTWIIVSSKAEGESYLPWKTSNTASPSARSLYDGFANTQAIADSEHPAARFCADCRAGGEDDWQLGSPDDMTVVARNLMPRSGGNPEQTIAEAFKAGGPQAFEQECYWTSAEYNAAYAWLQLFGYGYQSRYDKACEFRVRAVRKILPLTP